MYWLSRLSSHSQIKAYTQLLANTQHILVNIQVIAHKISHSWCIFKNTTHAGGKMYDIVWLIFVKNWFRLVIVPKLVRLKVPWSWCFPDLRSASALLRNTHSSFCSFPKVPETLRIAHWIALPTSPVPPVTRILICFSVLGTFMVTARVLKAWLGRKVWFYWEREVFNRLIFTFMSAKIKVSSQVAGLWSRSTPLELNAVVHYIRHVSSPYLRY